MPEKKPYSPPQLVRVELNHEQAILSTCSHATTAASTGNATWCKSAPAAQVCKGTLSGTGTHNSTGRTS